MYTHYIYIYIYIYICTHIGTSGRSQSCPLPRRWPARSLTGKPNIETVNPLQARHCDRNK